MALNAGDLVTAMTSTSPGSFLCHLLTALPPYPFDVPLSTEANFTTYAPSPLTPIQTQAIPQTSQYFLKGSASFDYQGGQDYVTYQYIAVCLATTPEQVVFMVELSGNLETTLQIGQNTYVMDLSALIPTS